VTVISPHEPTGFDLILVWRMYAQDVTITGFTIRNFEGY
jgi:hypothetical protein